MALTRVGPAPRTVTFGPRSDQVLKTVSWTIVPGGARCVRPAYALVTPTDETTSLSGRRPYGPVCGGRLAGTVYGVG